MSARDLSPEDLDGLLHMHAQRVDWQRLAPRVRRSSDAGRYRVHGSAPHGTRREQAQRERRLDVVAALATAAAVVWFIVARTA